MPDTDPRDLLWVEYHEIDGQWRPFSIATTDGQYDVEWCKRDQCLYAHDSGGGGRFHASSFVGAPGICAKVWVRKDIEIVHEVKIADDKWESQPLPREDLATMGYELLAKPLTDDPFGECEEEETQHCKICDDRLPCEEDSHTCNHLYWMDWGGWGGCGSDDTSESSVRKDLRAVFAMLSEGELIALRNGLLGRHYRSSVSGSMFGPDWLEFEVGGRWSDGKGGGTCRSKDAPLDVDDPGRGRYLVPFPVPNGADPGPIVDLGEKFTRHAEMLREQGDEDGWMNGINWLRSLVARDNCREAEKFTAGCIDEWLAETTGFQLKDEVANA